MLVCCQSVTEVEDDTPFGNMPPSSAGAGGGAIADAGGTSGAGPGLNVGGAGLAPGLKVGGAAGAAVGIGVCEPPTTMDPSGLVHCANGLTHRAEANACSSPGADAGAGNEGGAANEGGASARSSAGGTAGAVSEGGAAGAAGELGGLYAPCARDQDCAASFLCVCGLGSLPEGSCVPASCRTDADCGDGSWCALGAVNRRGDPGFSCSHSYDECESNSDCGAPTYFTCVIENGTRVCEGAAI
ncbi:MAG TPA: hypothetical protein VGM44_00695 [Polyangiaceae bacterium]